MRIRHQLPKPTSESPFEHDKLNREAHGKALTKICDLYDDGFVLALNGSWGTGKTSFIEMWLASLQKNRKTAYFNAWSDDYSDDPLPALLATFKELNKEESAAKTKVWKEVLELSSSLVKNGLPALLGLFAKKYVGVDNIDDLAEALSKGSIEYLTTEVKEFNERKDSFEKLQSLLTKYASSTTAKKKAVVVIDELDRCRPHYAVAVLELVKHLFSVDGVVFVLAIDKDQLKHAICGVYGSESLDATAYLQRFIDVEYRLPEAETNLLIDHLISYFVFGSLGSKLMNTHISTLQFDLNSFSSFLKNFQSLKKLSIRNLEKLLITIKLALDTIKPTGYLLPEFLFVLAYISYNHPELMQIIKSKKLTTVEMLSKIQDVLTPVDSVNADIPDLFVHVEACFVLFYNNFTFTRNRANLESENAYKFSGNNYGLESNYLQGQHLKHQIEALMKQYIKSNRIAIDYFIQKVEQFQGLEIT